LPSLRKDGVTGPELLSAFKGAPWKTAQAVDAFVGSLAAAPAAEIAKLLELLDNKSLRADAEAQSMRLLAFAGLVQKSADKSLFVPFVKALKASSDPQLRATLAQLLPAVNSVTEHPELCALLRSPDAQLRNLVAPVLTKIGARTVLEVLEGMLVERNFPARNEAMEIAVSIGGHRAIPALASVVSVGSPPEKSKALRYLASTKVVDRDRSAALQAIAGAFAEPSEQILIQAIQAYTAVGVEDDYFSGVAPFLEHASLPVAKAALEGLGRFASPRAIAALQRCLRAGPNAMRFAAIAGLEAIGTEDVLPALMEALGHNQPIVRARTAEALTRLGRAGKIELPRVVVFLLRSRDVTVRRMAVELLQSVSDPEGRHWPRLLGYMRDEDWWVRERIMDALVDLAGSALLPHVVVYLLDPSASLRRFAVDALLRLKAPESLGALVRTAASDADWWVRERAVAAIAAVKDQRAVPHLVDLMLKNPDLRVACVDALAAMDAKSASAHVAALLPSEDDDLSLAVLRFLKAVGDLEQSGLVKDLFKHQRATVRLEARGLLHAWAMSAGPEPAADGKLSALDRLLTAVVRAEGDDLILKPGYQPFVKRLGKTVPLAANVLSADQVKAVLMPHLSMAQVDELRAMRDVDFSYQLQSAGLRFRANVFQEVGGIAAVFRVIQGTLLDLNALGLPPLVATFKDFKGGMVLVGGPTGAGKSTTLAALIDAINSTSARHVISLEDPIEVAHRRKRSLINQREIGSHTRSFDDALRATLREDPDVILVGEMRDFPTISFAVTAAETGHLVLGTVHTTSASSSVDRLVTACPAAQQDDVRSMLAGSLRAVVCQFLLPRADRPGTRVLAAEVMVNNDAIANLIRKNKTFQIPSVIATSREQGMQLMDTELMRLHKEGVISAEEAYLKAANKKDFESLVGDREPQPSATKAAAAPRG
jgi:twitching motility protein PilT